jgi:C-terminal processing protease CtpA/Prc
VIWFDFRPGYVQPPLSRSGMRAAKLAADAFTVVLVTPGGPAAEAGLAKGDRIVAIDGVPAPQIAGSDFRRKVTQPAGTEVVLTVRRGDAERSVKLTLREMLP